MKLKRLQLAGCVLVFLISIVAAGRSFAAGLPGASPGVTGSELMWSQTAKLTASDGATDDIFGIVSISGDTAIVGASGENSAQGAAYIFNRNGNIWTQTAKLTAADGASGHMFGSKVSISGDTAIVGAFANSAAYIFTRNGGVWTQTAKLTASDGAAGDVFGIGVSISVDTVIVGAYAATVGANSQQGAAYIFVRSGNAWTQTAKLTASDGAANAHFGYSTSICGDTAIVGARHAAIGTNSNQGAAYIFIRSADTWMQTAKLTASDGMANALFGFSVSISGDAALVGAYGSNSNQGAAYIFTKGAAWTTATQAKLTASDGAALDNFGFSVSVSGDRAIVGANNATVGVNSAQGAAYMFERNAGIWTQTAKKSASDGTSGEAFGGSVSISEDTAIIGAIYAQIGASSSRGAAYVFRSPPDNKLTASDGAVNDRFGLSVSNSGDTAIVGAFQANSSQGAAYIFTRSGDIWIQTAELTASDGTPGSNFGNSVSISGEKVSVGAYQRNAAYVFTRSGGIWTQTAKITASDGGVYDGFGGSVSISGDTVMVGSYGSNSYQGAAYIFVRSGSLWGQTAKFTASDGAADDYFGYSVSISGDTAMAGAYRVTVGANSQQGAAYIFSKGATWASATQTKLTASDGAADDNFGISVSVSGDSAIVGAYNASVGSNYYQGTAYMFSKGASWTTATQTKFTAFDGKAGDYFGIGASISGDTAIVGAYNVTVGSNSQQGAAYMFSKGATWATATQTKLTAADGAALDFFGWSVSISGDTAIAGAFRATVGANSQQGAAYILKNPPARVTSLTATQGTFPDRIRLNWTGVSGATGYEIWRSDVNEIGLAQAIGITAASTYDDMLTANYSYEFYYWVRAVNNYTGEFSDSAFGTVTSAPDVELQNGTAVTRISGPAGSMTTYWLDVPFGYALLEFIVSGGTGDCDINVSLGGIGIRRYSIRSGTIENIQYETPAPGTYFVKIYAKTAYSGVTLMARCTGAAPIAPTGLAASKGTFADRIVLTWKASPCADSYDVYRALKVGKATPAFPGLAGRIATVANTEYEDTDPVIGAGATPNIYYYWVKAVNQIGSSKETAAASGNLMPVPAVPGAVAASDGTYFNKVRVTWSKTANITKYEVYRTTGAIFAGETLVGPLDASNLASYVLDDFNVPLNTSVPTKYYYWVKAINSVNDRSTLSKSDTGYVSNRGPATLTATKGAIYEKVRLSWAAVAGATSYDVYKGVLPPVNVLAPTTTYEDTPGDTGPHQYKVKATYVNGVITYASAFSPEVSGYAGSLPNTLAPPVLKGVSKNLYSYVHVTWGEVAKAGNYRVYRNPDFTIPGPKDVSGLSYDDITAVAGILYTYRVTAVAGATESLHSKSMTGMAAALTDSFGDTAEYPNGQTIAVTGADKGICKYYSIVVPSGTVRLLAALTGPATAADDCDVYAKPGSYPTTSSYNAKGSEKSTGEALTVSNPTAGTWYFLLYGAGTAGYTGRNLTVACYSAADIYLTTVPSNEQVVPYTATFKGRVVDKSGTGIAGLTLMARNPITGLSSHLTAKTNATGAFTYSGVISTEGEHTFDFFFSTMPDTAKGTAGHTVFTMNTSIYTSVFDFSAYLRATPLVLSDVDILGLQTFLNTANGWDENAVNSTYRTTWIEKTIGKVQSDTALLGKLDSGLYLFLYGVEGASAGNDTATAPSTSGAVPVSGLSPVPLIVHVDEADKMTVLSNLLLMNITDGTTNAAISGGKVGVLAIVSFNGTAGNKDISLAASEQLNLLSNIANNNLVSLPGLDGYYSNIPTKEFEVSVGGAPDRKISVITSSFVPDMTAIASP